MKNKSLKSSRKYLSSFGSNMNDQIKEPEEQANDVWDSVEKIAKDIIKVIIRIIKGDKGKPS